MVHAARFGGVASGPRATKGKRMAMKFLNKMSTKDKFSRHIPGMAHTEDPRASLEVQYGSLVCSGAVPCRCSCCMQTGLYAMLMLMQNQAIAEFFVLLCHAEARFAVSRSWSIFSLLLFCS